MASDVSAGARQHVADRAYHVCEYCLIHENDTFWGCQIDHIISRKHGGGGELTNLAWSCAICNNAKGSDIATLAGDPLTLTRLFNPRSDSWKGTFNLQAARIVPLSSIGQGTVNLLQLNQNNRLREREALAAIGRYPTIEALARMSE